MQFIVGLFDVTMSEVENGKRCFRFINKFKIKFVIFLAIHYALGSPSCFQSDNNTFTCTDCFCEMYPVFLFCAEHLLQFQHEPSHRNGQTLSLCIALYEENHIDVVYILQVYIGVPLNSFLNVKPSFQYKSSIKNETVDDYSKIKKALFA